MPLSATARRHRADLAELAGLAESDLSIVFRDVSSAAVVKEALNDTLPRLVEVYGSAAASLGADWYDELREQAEVRGRFRAIVAELPDLGRTESLAGFAVSPLFGAKPDATIALSKAAGGLQRIIYNADRDTVTRSSVQDRQARGWRREGTGKCDLCALILTRDAVYTEESSQFETHDNCGCIGVPDFG
ncbi:MAG: hypothetical protein ABWX92_12980 [Mycetocola sp.]